jgi:hypothetical protein
VLLTGILIFPFLGVGAESATTESAAGPLFVLSYQHNLLSANIQAISLKEVLQRLSQLTQIESCLDGSIGNESVTVEFENLPLEEGIRQILQGKSYALTYTQTSFQRGDTTLPKLMGIRVVPKGAIPPLGNERSDSSAPFSGSGPREDRPHSVAAQTAEASLPPDDATDSGLRDQDPRVREAALESLGRSDRPIPFDPIAEISRTDENPVLRMDALELLAEKGGDAALDPVREALKDPDPEVRGLAQGLMEEQRALALTRLEQLKVKNP